MNSPLMTILLFKRKEIKPSVCTNTKATWGCMFEYSNKHVNKDIRKNLAK